VKYNKHLQNTSRKKMHNIELIMNNKSEKKNAKNIFLSDKIKEKNNKIDKFK